MAKKGEKYQHKNITDVVYVVDTVDNGKGLVYLKDETTGTLHKPVTFKQLIDNYKRV